MTENVYMKNRTTGIIITEKEYDTFIKDEALKLWEILNEKDKKELYSDLFQNYYKHLLSQPDSDYVECDAEENKFEG